MADKRPTSTPLEKKGGYIADSKTPSQMRPPPPAFGQPKTNGRPSK